MSSSSWFSSLRTFLTPPSRQSLKFSRQLLLGLVFGFALSLSSTSLALYVQSLRRKKAIEDAANAGGGVVKRPIEIRQDEIVKGVVGLIGNTPLIRVNSLSDALGVEILGKAEYLNPGGSPKDRVALQIIEDAEASGLLHPHTGSCIFEGTVGSTGISIATIARAKGYDCEIVMPDDVAIEKVLVLEALGAKVVRVRPASIVDQTQFVNLARARALAFGETIITSLPSVKDELLHNAPHHIHHHATSDLPLAATTGDLGRADENGRGEDDLVVSDQSPPGERGEGWKEGKGKRGFFANQFENPSNHFAHYTTTGPEIWRQTNGSLDVFVSGAGTGGTLSGVGRYLKEISGAFDRYDDGLDEQINDLATTSSSSAAAATRAKKKVEVELGRMDPLDGSVLGGFGGEGGGRREGGVKVVLSDPSGSGLYNKVKYGVMYDSKESEGKKRRHQVDTVVEGIGINRITRNFELGEDLIDEAYRVTDAEAVAMSRHLVLADGLFLGSSSACNLVACVRAVKDGLVPPGGKIVTILCDSGSRHYSKFWSDKYLEEHGIEVSSDISAMLNE